MTRTVFIRNEGLEDLAGLAVSFAGNNAGNFNAGALAATTVSPGETTSFAITFLTGDIGLRESTMRIVSNDPDENPFDVSLQGTGITTLQSWAESFGLESNSLASDEDGDGITLIEEYAYNLNPTINDRPATTAIRLVDDHLQAEFIVRQSDPNLIYTVEFGNSPTEYAPATEPANVTVIDIFFKKVIINDSATTSTNPKRFGRIRLNY